MKAIRKDNVTPKQWAARMERQRKRRSNPVIWAKELAAERARWNDDRREKHRLAARKFRASPAGKIAKARSLARIAADPVRAAAKRKYMREYRQKWYRRNRERILAKLRAKTAANPKPPRPKTFDPLAYQRAYRVANKEHIRELTNAWRKRNRDHVLEVGRRKAAEYAKRHPERVEAARKRYVAKAGDAYVSHWLFGCKVKECPKELIELGRAKIALSRELRNQTK